MSALALLKVAMHASSGGNLEVILYISFELHFVWVQKPFKKQDHFVCICFLDSYHSMNGIICQLWLSTMGQVMGLLQGKIVHDTFVVIDSFPLPVEGTETRVNVMEEANVFMFEFLEKSQVGCAFHYFSGGYTFPLYV